MANRYANLVGSKKISEDFNSINVGFGKVQDDVDELQTGLAQEISDRETAVQAIDDRVDEIIQGGGPDKDAELVDIRTPDPSYTPEGPISTAGGMTRDMQRQFIAHLNDVANPHSVTSAQVNILPSNSFPETEAGSSYPNGITQFFVTSPDTSWRTAVGSASAHGWVTTYKTGSSVFQEYREMYTGTSTTDTILMNIWYRTKRDSNSFWQPWINIITSAGGTIKGAFTVESSNPTQITAKRSNANNNVSMKYENQVGDSLFTGMESKHVFGFSYNNDLASSRFKFRFDISALEIDGAVILRGTGAPEGFATAFIGSLYLRRDGGTGTTLYVKESGTGNTGWKAK